MPKQYHQSRSLRIGAVLAALCSLATLAAAQAPTERAWKARQLGAGNVLQFLEAGAHRWAVTTHGLYKRGFGVWDRQHGLPGPFHTQLAGANNGVDLYAILGKQPFDEYDDFFSLIPMATAAAPLWRSRDGGVTWSSLALPPEAQAVDGVAVARGNPRRVWVTDRNLGLLKSRDRGESWVVHSSLPPNSSPLDIGLPTLDPSDPRRMFVNIPGKTYRSDDEGRTWHPLGSGVRVNSLTFDLNRPGVIWGIKRRRLSRSQNNGQTWQETEPPIGGARTISVPSFDPLLVGATMHEGVRISRDGGNTFTDLWLPERVLSTDVTFDRRGRVLVSTNGAGVYRAEIDGELQPLNVGLNAARVRTVQPVPVRLPHQLPQFEGHAEDLYSGVETGGLHVSNGPEPSVSERLNWLYWLEVSHLVVDPFGLLHALDIHFGYSNLTGTNSFFDFSNDELVATQVDGATRLYGNFGYSNGVWRSDDSGNSWAHYQSADVPYPASQQTTGLTVDGADGNKVTVFEVLSEYLMPSRQFLKRTADGGLSWTTLAEVDFNVHAIIADPQIADRLWLGVDSESSHGLYLSTDGGASMTPRGFSGQFIRHIEVDPQDPDHLWVLVPHQTGVWETRDAGHTWNQTPGSEEFTATDIALGTVGTLYAGGAGGTWQLDFASLPGAPVTLQDRFDIKVAWRDRHSRLHPGFKVQAGALASDSAAFWFFGPDNVELLVKVLDGRTINQHFWIFAGVATDVPYCLEVVDRVTGKTFSHCQEGGQQRSIADVEALPALSSEPTSTTTTPHLSPLTVMSTGASQLLPDATVQPQSQGQSTSLPLRDGTLRVEMSFVTPNGETTEATGVPLTNEAGAFWFFGPNNLEILLKVVDGRVVNGKFWVFWGSLTTLEYTIDIYSDCCGDVAVWSHTQPAGPSTSGADTQAF